MTTKTFYEIYDKLNKASTSAEKLAAIGELAQACRENKNKTTPPEDRLGQAKICIQVIAESPEMFAKAVTMCIGRSEDIPLAKALAHESSVRHMKQPAAEHYDLSSLDEDASILAVCRLCKLYVTPVISLGWALSLLVSFPNSDKAKKAAAHLLEYHVDEFPGTTLRLLEATESSFTAVAAATDALNFLREENTHLKSLPNLSEFAMTSEMRLTLATMRRRQNRDIQGHARQKSVFMQICAVQHFKYANKTSVEVDMGAQIQETIMEMSPYSLEVELPLSEQTDPMVGASRRRGLWKGIPE
jgi:hypothetical protein